MSAPILTASERAREAAPVPVPRGVSARELLDHLKPLATRAVAGDAGALAQMCRLVIERGDGAV